MTRQSNYFQKSLPDERAGGLAAPAESARASAAPPCPSLHEGGQTTISPPSKVKLPKGPPPKCLASGIDTLYLSIDVKWTDSDFFSYLSTLKSKAEASEQSMPGLLADWPFLLQPYGRRGYAWLLESKEFNWRVGNWISPQSRPSVIIEIRSETLWHLGAQESIGRVLSLLNYASHSNLSNPTIVSVKVSRADLCLDLILPESIWSLELLPFIVCRAQNIRPHLKGCVLTGLSIGAGKLSARLYDKPLEIKTKSHKEWMYDIWGQSEVPEKQRIIRVEFQIMREALKELGIDNQTDLFRLESNAWAYCTQKWLKFQDRPGTHHTQRNTFPWWEVIQDNYKGAQKAYPLVRCKAVKANQTQLIRQTYGLLSSLTALQMEEVGEDIAAAADFNDCLSALFETVGLLGEHNDFGTRVYQKRARYHRSKAKADHAHDLRQEFGLLDNTKENTNDKGE